MTVIDINDGDGEETVSGGYVVHGEIVNEGWADTFNLNGDITNFEVIESEGDWRVEIDAEDRTSELLSAGNEFGVGGGDYYTDSIREDDADYVANTESQLNSHLNSASSGDVVFLATDVTMTSIDVPNGVTLASGRGTPDHTARIDLTSAGTTAIEMGRNARVTGLIVDGYETRYRRHNSFSGGVYIGGRGIDMNGSNGRVDNCEVFGNERGVTMGGTDCLVEHCDIHHHSQGGLGYGIRANGDRSEIAYCTLDYNRHSIATAGNVGYHAHDNWCGPHHYGHVFDHHDGGRYTEINNNKIEQDRRPYASELDDLATPTINGVEVRNAGGNTASVTIRGDPSQSVECHHNWTFNPDDPDDMMHLVGGTASWHRPAFNQMHTPTGRYTDMNVYENHYGPSDPNDPDIGIRLDENVSVSGSKMKIIADEGGYVEYEFETDETPTRAGSGLEAANSEDTITGTEDGARVRGSTPENDVADTWELHGDLLDFTVYTPPESVADFSLYLNGEDVTDDLLTFDADELLVFSQDDRDLDYTFQIDGEAEKIEGGTNDAEADDEITDHGDGTFTIDGAVGQDDAEDTFEFDGTIDDIDVSADGDFRVMVDGVDVTDDWIPADTFPTGDNPPIGSLTGEEIPTRSGTSDNHYIWVDSGGTSDAIFSFRTTEGNIGIDTDPTGSGYWTTEDRTIAGGVAEVGETSLPGFFFDGTIERFEYSGDIQVYINGSSVQPDAVEDYDYSTPEPGDQPDSISDWSLTFEDDFDQSSIDDNPYWGAGWGWGPGSPGAKQSWVDVPGEGNIHDHIEISDSKLILTADYDHWNSEGDLHVGAVHSRADGWIDPPDEGITVDPPVYFSARMKTIAGAGWQNAFWTKPNNEDWPPEIDVMEVLQGSGSSVNTSHNLHYSASGNCGDSSTHSTENGSHSNYTSGEYPHETFHTYGFEWREDVMRHYVDGQVVEETTDSTILSAFNNTNCRPHYLMLSLNLDNVGTTDKSGSWDDKQLEIDWVRIYEP